MGGRLFAALRSGPRGFRHAQTHAQKVLLLAAGPEPCTGGSRLNRPAREHIPRAYRPGHASPSWPRRPRRRRRPRRPSLAGLSVLVGPVDALCAVNLVAEVLFGPDKTEHDGCGHNQENQEFHDAPPFFAATIAGGRPVDRGPIIRAGLYSGPAGLLWLSFQSASAMSA